MRHAADRHVILDIDRPGCRDGFAIISRGLRRVVSPMLPGPHERVLKARQLVRIVAYVIEQAIDQARCDLAAANPDGLDNGGTPLLSGHAWNEVQSSRYSLGKITEPRTIADIIRA